MVMTPMSRRENDRYLTPTWATEALLQHFPGIRGDVVGDPCCGDGRMAAQLLAAKRFRSARLNDLAPIPGASGLDAADPALYHQPVDWVVSNPPFMAAGEIALCALRNVRSVALLLRCTFGEPCAASPKAPRNGRQWLVKRPPTALLMLPRISFTGNGETDSAPCWWFIWSPDVSGIRLAARAESAGQLGLALEGGR